jgi:hypothetical protein
MIPARRVTERAIMRASRSISAGRRASGARKPATPSRVSRVSTRARKTTTPVRKAAAPARKTTKLHPVPLEPVLFRFCKPGWAVLVEKQPSQQGTRFVCPFCPHSHRVSGPVRGFRKVRRAQWIKLRRVDE